MAFAKDKDVFLTRISNDSSSKTYDLLLQINQRGLIGGFKTRNNKKKKTKFYGLDVLDKPIILAKSAGITLVSLKCENFNTALGCDMKIRYPSNITFGQFKTFEAALKKDDKGKWGMFNQGKRFSEMRLITRKALGVMIGAKRIETK